MNFSAQYIPYSDTAAFSTIVTDYVAAHPLLEPYYQYPVSMQSILLAIQARQQFSTNRQLLSTVLMHQYAGMPDSELVLKNIEKLADPNCFTITTAHQPNLFTGHLYFIYKILQVIRMADQFNKDLPAYSFVPVYYMGSEDADLAELGHVNLNGGKIEWATNQTGAVGRMKVDKALLEAIDQVSGQLSIAPFGEELVSILRAAYKEGTSIEQAVFNLVHQLFAKYGLIVFLPDHPEWKSAFAPIMQQELETAFSHQAVAAQVKNFPAEYKVQAGGRDINLFYLQEGRRDRITLKDKRYIVNDTQLVFSKEALLQELAMHPERFSPNVILRPVLQEMLLPNIVFVGGGGEIAYWLELKKVFEIAGIPYPLMVLRNSFLIMQKKELALASKIGLQPIDLFRSEQNLLSEVVKKTSSLQLDLEKEKAKLIALYDEIEILAANIDPSLGTHTKNLLTKAFKRIEQLEKKMLRAEKLKFETLHRQLHQLKSSLFPLNNLQERGENFMPYYAQYGAAFIQMLYQHSLLLEQKFAILKEE